MDNSGNKLELIWLKTTGNFQSRCSIQWRSVHSLKKCENMDKFLSYVQLVILQVFSRIVWTMKRHFGLRLDLIENLHSLVKICGLFLATIVELFRQSLPQLCSQDKVYCDNHVYLCVYACLSVGDQNISKTIVGTFPLTQEDIIRLFNKNRQSEIE